MRCPRCNCLMYDTVRDNKAQYGCPTCFKFFPKQMSESKYKPGKYLDLLLYLTGYSKQLEVDDDFKFWTIDEDEERSE